MAPPTPAPLRTLGRLLRAVAGLALLLALTAGLPALLLKVGHQPGELSGGWHLLTQQDDGSLLLVVLTLIGWAAWAAFTGSAILETVALLRGRSARRIRGLGGLQSLAGFLIGSIVLLAPTAASAATPASAVAATAAHTVGTASPTPSATPSTAALPTDKTNWPTHTVSSATEAPWDLAVTYLGDGQRWKDIAALNPDVPHISAGDQYLPMGAVIKLPADARTTAATAGAAAAPASPMSAPHPPAIEHQDEKTTAAAASHPAAEATEHTVQDGENLSLIAGETYGDPDKWPEIFEANKGEHSPAATTSPTPTSSIRDSTSPSRTRTPPPPLPPPPTGPASTPPHHRPPPPPHRPNRATRPQPPAPGPGPRAGCRATPAADHLGQPGTGTPHTDRSPGWAPPPPLQRSSTTPRYPPPPRTRQTKHPCRSRPWPPESASWPPLSSPPSPSAAAYNSDACAPDGASPCPRAARPTPSTACASTSTPPGSICWTARYAPLPSTWPPPGAPCRSSKPWCSMRLALNSTLPRTPCQ